MKSNWEECCVSCECNIWFSPITCDEIFLLHPLIVISLSYSLSILYSTYLLIWHIGSSRHCLWSRWRHVRQVWQDSRSWHFQATYQSLLSSPSAVFRLLAQMYHHEILLLRHGHDSGLHKLCWPISFAFHLSHLPKRTTSPCLSSPSSTEFVIDCCNLSIFSSDLLTALIISFLKNIASSLRRDGLLSHLSMSFLFFRSSSVSVASICSFCPSRLLFSRTFQSLFLLHCCFLLLFSCHLTLCLGSRDTSCLVGSMSFFQLVYNNIAAFMLSVAFDTDCLSVDYSHGHCHVGVICSILVHTFVVDLASIFNVEREDVLQGLGHIQWWSYHSHQRRTQRCTKALRFWTDEPNEPATSSYGSICQQGCQSWNVAKSDTNSPKLSTVKHLKNGRGQHVHISVVKRDESIQLRPGIVSFLHARVLHAGRVDPFVGVSDVAAGRNARHFHLVFRSLWPLAGSQQDVVLHPLYAAFEHGNRRFLWVWRSSVLVVYILQLGAWSQ